MAASIARTATAVLLAMAMLGSVAVGPALADDDVDVGDDGVSVGGDDGITVDAGDDGSENGSTTVEAEAGQDGADAGVEASAGDGSGTDGAIDCDVSSGTQDPSNVCETSGGDGSGDDGGAGVGLPDSGDTPEAPDGDAPNLPDGDLPEAPDGDTSGFPDGNLPAAPGGNGAPSTTMDEVTTPEVPVDAPELPVTYTGEGIEAQGETVVPFAALPNYCNPPYGVDDVQETNPVDPTDPAPDPVKEQAPGQVPTQPPQTPVGDPIGLISAPISQCDVFNPYDPSVNPTSPPDDPSATADPAQTDVGQDGVGLYWLSESTADEGESSPGSETLSIVSASQDRSVLILRGYGTDGQSRTGGEADVRSPNDPSQTDAEFVTAAFSRSASLSIDCDGSECKPSADGVPSGDAVPAFPAGGGDGGEDPQPAPSGDTSEPETMIVNGDRVYIADDRAATLGQGLPGGDNDVLIVSDGQRTVARQDAQGSQGDNQVNAENSYDSGQYPGDDEGQINTKANGAGVIAGFDCDDYRCTPAENTGVYAGPGGMIFDMIPDAPEPVPQP